MTTFSDLLARQLRTDPGLPLITFYDEATGERVELSTTTYANWVAKTASLLTEEHDLERGQRLAVDLPAHWLGAVFLGAAWTVGLVVVGPDDQDAEVDAVVCGPATLERWAERADDLPVLACSLLPLGVRFADPVPPGVHDVGIEVWSQPDAFVSYDPPAGDDPATAGAFGERTHAEMWGSGRRRESPHRRRPPSLGGEPGFPTGDRLLHRATSTRRLAGAGRPLRTGAARGDVRRGARHGSLPLRASSTESLWGLGRI